MTLSFEPRTTDYLTLTELLDLFDHMTGYGIDRHSRDELEKLDAKHKEKHVVDAKTAHRIVIDYIQDEYARRNGKPPRNEKQRNSIIRCDGFLGDTVYHRDDILLMMRNPNVRERLAEEFKRRTVLLEGIYVPKIVAADHPIDPANQKLEDWYF